MVRVLGVMNNWKTKWCGEYMDYKGCVIIRNPPGKAAPYEVFKENQEGKLLPVGTATTIKESKKLINCLHGNKNNSIRRV